MSNSLSKRLDDTRAWFDRGEDPEVIANTAQIVEPTPSVFRTFVLPAASGLFTAAVLIASAEAYLHVRAPESDAPPTQAAAAAPIRQVVAAPAMARPIVAPLRIAPVPRAAVATPARPSTHSRHPARGHASRGKSHHRHGGHHASASSAAPARGRFQSILAVSSQDAPALHGARHALCSADGYALAGTRVARGET